MDRHLVSVPARNGRRRRARATPVVLAILILLSGVHSRSAFAAPGELDEVEVLPLDPSFAPSEILGARPFVVPGDRCPVFCISEPDNANGLDEAAARSRLSRFMLARVTSEAARLEALTRFDATETAEIVPDPVLRASLLMLNGWEPYDAIVAAVLDGENSSGLPFADVSFQEFDDLAVAYLGGTADGRFALRVNRSFAAEAPETLANVLIHEALHDPYVNSYEEEVIANILDGLAYAEILLIRPELATTTTTLTVYNNFALLALLNSSGAAGPERLGISTTRFGDVWLGPDLRESDASSLRDAIAGDNVYAGLPRGGTPGGPILAALLDRFPNAKDLGPEPHFDETTLDLIDAGIGNILAPAEAVTLARILGLGLAGPVVEIPPESIGPLPSDPDMILPARPLVPRDVTLFDPAAPTATRITLRSERSARAELAEILDVIDAAPEMTSHVLDRLDDSDLERRVPSPSLRAAVALLALLPGGTPTSDALVLSPEDSALFAGNEVAVFAPLPHGTAFLVRPAGDGLYRLEVNERLRGENLGLLASLLLQAVVTLPAGPTGETSEDQAVLAAALGTLVYAELLTASPDLALAGTWAVAERNRALLALVNSAPVRPDGDDGSPNGSVGLLDPAEGVADVFPNLYSDTRSFEADVLSRPGASDLAATRRLTAPRLVVAAVEAFGVPATPSDRSPTFGDLLAMLDARLGALLPPEMIARLAEALDLGVT